MSRAARRRNKRTPAAGLTPTQRLAVWHLGRRLPADHPLKAAEPIPSSEELGFRCIDVVEQARPFERMDPQFKASLSDAHKVAIKAFLVCALIAVHQQELYRRSDIVAVLHGLHPAVAETLGVLDNDGVMCPVIADTLTVLVEGANSETPPEDELGWVA